jgi:hypothetical protein
MLLLLWFKRKVQDVYIQFGMCIITYRFQIGHPGLDQVLQSCYLDHTQCPKTDVRGYSLTTTISSYYRDNAEFRVSACTTIFG